MKLPLPFPIQYANYSDSPRTVLIKASKMMILTLLSWRYDGDASGAPYIPAEHYANATQSLSILVNEKEITPEQATIIAKQLE